MQQYISHYLLSSSVAEGCTEQVEHFVPILWGEDEVTNLLSEAITYLSLKK